MNLQELKIKLKELDVKPSKKLGQNFLINTDISLKIMNKVQESSPVWVEIGPGMGTLTNFFNSKKEQIFLIERDKKLASYWKRKGFSIFCEDALKFDWNQIPHFFTLFGNLPFQIAGSIVLEMCLLKKSPKRMILMMQKEVAERVLAKTHTKDYGLLSVMAQIFWNMEFIINVGRNNFYPVPEVDGRVLSFAAKKFPSIFNAKGFLLFIKTCFSQRRKKLIRQLPKNFLKDWERFFMSKNWNLNIRAEELSPSQFLLLYQEFERLQRR